MKYIVPNSYWDKLIIHTSAFPFELFFFPIICFYCSTTIMGSVVAYLVNNSRDNYVYFEKYKRLIINI